MAADLCYTQSRAIHLPDAKITEIKENHTYVPMRGYSYILAVFEGVNPIGWISAADLGYPNVKAWCLAQGWFEQSFS